jgi:hypothetical protein
MNTAPNISALAREHGVSRKTIRRRLAAGWRPDAPTLGVPMGAPETATETATGRDLVAAAPSSPPIPLGAPVGVPGHDAPTPMGGGRLEVLPPVAHSSSSGALILIAVALAIGALALAINGQTGWRFGTTTFAAITFASLSVAADVLAITLPAAAVALWHARRRGLAVAAWIVAGVALTGAALASLGFAELHLGDTAAGRHAIVATSSALADQRTARIAAAERAASVATKAREGECAVRGPRCREREAEERTALSALTDAIAAPVPAVPTIAADADPQVTAALRLATWLGLKLAPDDVVNFRLGLMAMLPNIAGLVLAFGVALRGR